ncbi:hypothetical protein DIPPA_04036 [Diplonema papillatum]|nr:hypothetical protein DIPPA_04025 [Diplonema papillatum]KAJ9447268.1 hypothetical protein DIPPA_04036 [Diplonema papillatum]
MHRTGSSVEAWLAAVVAITLAATVSVDEGIDDGEEGQARKPPTRSARQGRAGTPRPGRA